MGEQDGNNAADNVAFMPGKNGGRLRRGGIAGPGPGRPRKATRDMLLAEFVEQMPKLRAEIGKKGKITRREYVEMCAKYGLGTTITETDSEGEDIKPFTFVIDSPNDDGSN